MVWGARHGFGLWGVGGRGRSHVDLYSEPGCTYTTQNAKKKTTTITTTCVIKQCGIQLVIARACCASLCLALRLPVPNLRARGTMDICVATAPARAQCTIGEKYARMDRGKSFEHGNESFPCR